MIKSLSSVWVFFILSCAVLSAQNNDPVLFTVDNSPVRVSEFNYIYSKTNGEEADYSKASLQEYLDLYTKFKLKVRKAKDLQLDTIQELQKELAGYRRQLADSYLINKEVTEQLTREAYERKKQDVEFNHIFFQMPNNPKPADTLAAFQRAAGVKRELSMGNSFATLAKKYSDDRSAQNNGGRLGYVSALFPNGFYPLEKAAYSLEINEVSHPIRTTNGYHLLMISNRRPARGEVEIAHILIRTSDKVKADVKTQMDSIYQALQGGANFTNLAKQYSDDARTAPKGGYIGYIRINQFEEAFEDEAFGIEADNQYSAPFESSLGYHIVKRISKKDLGTFEKEKIGIESQVKKDSRFEASKKALIKSIKKNGNFQEFPLVLERFIQTQNDTFFTFRWKAPKRGGDQVLFSLAEEKIDLNSFWQYLTDNTRQRLRLDARTTVREGVKSLYNSFIDDTCMRLEESQLEEKYPEFKALMREYEEGILLFEVTKRNVWDKAAQDTSGLKKFYETIKGKYQWNDRAIVTKYVLNQRDRALLDQIRSYVAEHTPEEVKTKFKIPDLQTSQEKVEKGKSIEAKNIKEWKAGHVSTPLANTAQATFSFVKLESVEPARAKTLNEARGYIIADYQDFLEKKWVDQLKSEYKIEINNKVFESLVK